MEEMKTDKTYKVSLDFILDKLFESNDVVDKFMIEKACKRIKQSVNIDLTCSQDYAAYIASRNEILDYQAIDGSSFVIYNKTFTKRFRCILDPLNGAYFGKEGDNIKEILRNIDLSDIRPECDHIIKKNDYILGGKRLSEINFLSLEIYASILIQLPKNIQIEGVDNKELCAAISYQLENVKNITSS